MTDKDSSPDGVEGSVVAVGVTSINDGAFHYAARGGAIDELSSSDSIDGFDSERMRDRTLLTAEEEKKLLRRIDWHLMPLCSLIFMFKNLDSQNVRSLIFSHQSG